MKHISLHPLSFFIITVLLLGIVISPVFAQTIVVNAEFTSGNTGFISDYIYTADLPGVNNEMEPEGLYGVGYNANDYHWGWVSSGDHTTGTGQMFIANGSSDITKNVWQGTINQDLVIGTVYDFSAWMMDLSANGTHASLTFKADGVTINTLTIPSYQTWVRLTGTFTAQSLRPTLTLTNAVSAATGNDFAVDDINIFYEGTTDLPSTATVTTLAATSVSATSATLGGNITDDGGFTISERGVVYSSTDTEPFIGDTGVNQNTNEDETNEFSEPISPLLPGTTYYFQAYAKNSAGTSYGGVETFTTSNATITFTNGSSYSTSITPGSNDQVLGRFQLGADVDGASLTNASIQLDGTRTGLSNLKLWSSADAVFGSDTQLGSTVTSDPGDGSPVSFSGFTNAISASGVYYFLTGDISSDATGNIQGVIINNSSLTLDKGTFSGPISNAPLSNGDASLPVELVSFSSTGKSNSVILQWTTASEIDNVGFIIERQSANSSWLQIASYMTDNSLAGQGTTFSATQYSFTDNDVTTESAYTYRLSEVSANGAVKVIGETSTAITALPNSTQLYAAYPNPFNPATTLDYQLAKDGQVSITVYDMLGRQVRTLVNMQLSAGQYSVQWNGTNDAGMSVPSGTYLVRIQTKGYDQVQKILFVK